MLASVGLVDQGTEKKKKKKKKKKSLTGNSDFKGICFGILVARCRIYGLVMGLERVSMVMMFEVSSYLQRVKGQQHGTSDSP